MINDSINDEARHRLALCAPRIAGSKIDDPATEQEVDRKLTVWLSEGAGSGLPLYLHPAQSIMTMNPPELFIQLPKWTLTGGDEYAVQWYEALVAHYEELTACEPSTLPVERWLAVKELVGQ